MPDGDLDVTGRLNKFSKTMIVSALSASDRGHAPIVAGSLSAESERKAHTE